MCFRSHRFGVVCCMWTCVQSNRPKCAQEFSIQHTSHSSWHHFTHAKGRITHFLNVESRRQPYDPHPHTNQHVKVSTLCKTHSSVFSKQTVSHQVRMCFRSGFGVVSVCGHVSRQTQTQNRHGFYLHHPTHVICNLMRESCMVSLQSKKMYTRSHCTHTHISHTSWHHSHMSREGSLTD